MLANLVETSASWRFPDDDGQISEDDLRDVFTEILRLYPPFIGGYRVVNDNDLVLGDFHVPAGYGVMYHFLAAHMDKAVFHGKPPSFSVLQDLQDAIAI